MRKSFCNCVAGGILLLACASCKPREAEAPHAPATAASAPAATMPTIAPVSATFSIGGRAVLFHAPAISLNKSGTPAQLIVYSDDDAPGGSFYFEVPVESEWTVGSAVSWEEELHPTADDESVVGIHLPGRTLLPESLRVTVRQISANIAHVDIAGEFAIHIDDASVLGTSVKVSGEFLAAFEQ